MTMVMTVIVAMIEEVIIGGYFGFAWWFLMEQGSYPSSYRRR